MNTRTCLRAGTRLGTFVLLAFLGVGALPQTPRQDEGTSEVALSKARLLLRQVAAQKTELEQEAAQLRNRIAELELQIADERLRAHALGVETERAQQDYVDLEKRLYASAAQSARTENSLRELAIKFRSQEDLLHELGVVRQGLAAQVAERNRQLEDCAAKNTELYALNRDLLEKLAGQDLVHTLIRNEPFTGLGRIDVENAIEEYRYRLEGLRYEQLESGTSNNKEQRDGVSVR